MNKTLDASIQISLPPTVSSSTPTGEDPLNTIVSRRSIFLYPIALVASAILPGCVPKPEPGTATPPKPTPSQSKQSASTNIPKVLTEPTLNPEQQQYLDLIEEGIRLVPQTVCFEKPGKPRLTQIPNSSARSRWELPSTGEPQKWIEVDIKKLLSINSTFSPADRRLNALLIGAEETRHYCEAGKLFVTGLESPLPSGFIGSILLIGDLRTNYKAYYELTEAISNYGAYMDLVHEGSFAFLDRCHEINSNYMVIKLFQKLVEAGFINFEELQKEIYNPDPNVQLRGINRLSNSTNLTDPIELSKIVSTQNGSLPKLVVLMNAFTTASSLDHKTSLANKQKALNTLFETIKALYTN